MVRSEPRGNTPGGVCGGPMEQLSSDNLRKILSAIEILASADDSSSLPGRSLDAVMTAIDCDFASYAEVDLEHGRNRFLVKPDIGKLDRGSQEFARFVRRFGNHPILAHQMAAQPFPSEPRVESFLLRLRLLGMVGNCCGDVELLLNLGLTVEEKGRRMVGLSINRGIRDFDEHDVQILAMLKPHIIAASRIAQRLERTSPPLGKLAGGVTDLSLTTRESQVLYWVSMGKTNSEVGTIIGARPLTVKKHLEHIYDKLGVPNRMAAARMLQMPAG